MLSSVKSGAAAIVITPFNLLPSSRLNKSEIQPPIEDPTKITSLLSINPIICLASLSQSPIPSLRKSPVDFPWPE